MIPCFIYARKSTEAEDRQVLSIESQVKELKEAAEKKNLAVVDIFIEAKSAKEPGRPIFNAMIQRLKKGEAEGVLCWKLDRLSRNPIDSGTIGWVISKYGLGLKVFTPSQSFSSENENGVLGNIEFAMAQKYIEDLSKNVKRGIRMKLEKGEWPGPAPLGYLNDLVSKKIIKDPERFAMIRKMWDLILSGSCSVEKILHIANEELGLRTRQFRKLGGKKLCKSAVYKIFTDPFYAGMMHHKQGIYPGAHEPMVTQGEFDRVQEILGRNDRPKSKTHFFPFAGGLIKCGECGCSITAEHRINRHGSHYIYYHCTKKKRDIKCSQPYIQAAELENQMVSFLEKLSVPDDLAEWIFRFIHHFDDEQKLISHEQKGSLAKTLHENQKHVDELNRMRYRGLINDEEYLKEKARLLQDQHKLEASLKNFDSVEYALLPTVEKLIHFANRAPIWFRNAEAEHKRLIIETVGSNPALMDKTLLMQAQTPFQLFEIKKASIMRKNQWFEPRNYALDKQKAACSAALIPAWQGRMNDVRTLLTKNDGWVQRLNEVLGLLDNKA